MDNKLFLKLIGVLFMMCLSLVANNPFIYGLAIFIIATLVTELNFISILAAMFWNRPEFFKHLERMTELQQEDSRVKVEHEDQLLNLVTDLGNRSLNLERLNTTLQQERNLYQLFYHFERTYRLIFGSQLNLLNWLKSSPSQKLPISQAIDYYRNLPISTNYSMENYFGFLINFLLIEFNAGKGTYLLTPVGNSFLTYLQDNNISLNVPN